METTSAPSAWTRMSLVFLGLFPAMVSLGFHLKGPAAAEMPAPERRPALAFDQYAVNLGPIRVTGVAEAKFRFTNAGDKTVKITGLRTSCGCLQPKLEKRDYAPGETGEFAARVATAGEMPGPRHYTITIDYLDPEPRSVVLTFRLELPSRQLYISPRALMVYQFGEQPVTNKVLLTDNRPNFATVTGLDSPADYVSAQLVEAETDGEGVRTTRIDVTIKSVPMGLHHTNLQIRTDDPKFPVLNVPIRVHRQPPPKIGSQPAP